jgi:hypothetical protein
MIVGHCVDEVDGFKVGKFEVTAVGTPVVIFLVGTVVGTTDAD